ncbi:F-box/FBD/LRR-repeat protein [Thalictrum thalictroides]|uniref:F-box/FBD/LRR-repeat protein n=1 Tax=Thalictrum thalictroides TaxID=46969 RepID=A0A7J6VQ80_THATH|nr:F-box/FBD/LRR-repeat protein [Thalictrum thalictroides]
MGTLRTKKLNNPDDRISQMPDEVLSFMLLLLLSEEEARTSILSRRWRYVLNTSAAYSSSLNLDVVAMRGSPYSVSSTDLLLIEQLKFIKWVDQILQLDYRPTMDSFRLRFCFNKDSADHINRWINMAISKSMKYFDIDLSHFHNLGYCLPNEEFYTFPDWLFTCETGSLVKLLCLKACIFRPLDFKFSSLIDLQLDHVLIDQDCFVNFLSSCPNLEKLCLIFRIYKIDARNLNRLEYRGYPVHFTFLNVPQLSNIIVYFAHGESISADVTRVFYSFSSQLPKLDSLMMHGFLIKKPILPSLVKSYIIPLLHGSPYLHTLELHWCFPSVNGEGDTMQKPFDSPHCYLKNITVSGFRGSAHEIEFTTYLLHNAKTLETFSIFKAKKHYSYERGYFSFDGGEIEMEEVARKQLINVLPLVLLNFRCCSFYLYSSFSRTTF